MVKVKYDPDTKAVKGYYVNDINYGNKIDISNKLIEGLPYIEISKEAWQANRDKQMMIENNQYIEDKRREQEGLEQIKKAKRLRELPSVQKQLDVIWEQINQLSNKTQNTIDMLADIENINNKYSKGD